MIKPDHFADEWILRLVHVERSPDANQMKEEEMHVHQENIWQTQGKPKTTIPFIPTSPTTVHHSPVSLLHPTEMSRRLSVSGSRHIPLDYSHPNNVASSTSLNYPIPYSQGYPPVMLTSCHSSSSSSWALATGTGGGTSVLPKKRLVRRWNMVRVWVGGWLVGEVAAR